MAKSFKEIGLDKSIQHIGVIMEKLDTKNYPRYELPNGYSFVYYTDGLENKWARLQLEVEQVDSLEEAQNDFLREFAPYKDKLYKNMIFVKADDDTIVATGCVWNGRMFGDNRLRLHWIAVAPAHQGKGILKAMMTKLMDIYNENDNCNGYIHLTSQTWSYKALNVYMQFGFKPYFGEKPVNWRAVNLTSGNFEPYFGEKPVNWRAVNLTSGNFEPWDYKEKNQEAWDMIYEKINQYNKQKTAKY